MGVKFYFKTHVINTLVLEQKRQIGYLYRMESLEKHLHLHGNLAYVRGSILNQEAGDINGDKIIDCSIGKKKLGSIIIHLLQN